MAMMAITTSNSINVKPARERLSSFHVISFILFISNLLIIGANQFGRLMLPQAARRGSRNPKTGRPALDQPRPHAPQMF
jgi:hypothetical protein